ncbi:hypothetical protein FA15DRAFT_662527 [Coprinopsis marcescibilis]|uniref:Nuclear protein DGCR14 n=1 Tax=Coprinopsis marcescibilis TaxID=230819 RepID=A0A5C3LD33_COPMA|nr:hypothetical protein FA15DRAFT_662527 [Coprinopsis marcescibilis]
MSEHVDATPAPERSLYRQFVLDEDDYTAALSKIIARDFFPSLVHLDATNGYLDAVSSKDPHLIQASVRRLQELGDTPLVSRSQRGQFESPSQTPWSVRSSLGEGSSRPSKRPKYDTNLSLDAFQAKYTSEDNSSFTQILDEENRQRQDKYGWAWDAQRRVEAQKSKAIESRERMLIEAPPAIGVRKKMKIEAPKMTGLLTEAGEDVESNKVKGKKREMEGGDEEPQFNAKTSVMALPNTVSDGLSTVDVLAPTKDTRSAGVDGWKFKARNTLMFAPDADLAPYHHWPGAEEPTKFERKKVVYNGTRLQEQEERGALSSSVSAPPSPTRSRIDAAISGTTYVQRSPRNAAFSLVPNVPSPTPAQLGPAGMKQLMTWGTLNATPRVISQSEDDAKAITPATPFHLPRMSQREALSQQLSSKASKSLRAKADMLGLRTPGLSLGRTLASGKKGNMAPPNWTPRKAEAAGNLTPAAKRLLRRTTMSTAGARRAEAMERSASWDNGSREKELNDVRWTPTPSSDARR